MINPIKLIVSILVIASMSLVSMSYLNYSFHKNKVLSTQSQLYNCLDILERTPKQVNSQCNDYLCVVSFGKTYDNQLSKCQAINDNLEKYFNNYESLPQTKWLGDTIIR